jgi:methionine synthase II (cobalamin-independent)
MFSDGSSFNNWNLSFPSTLRRWKEGESLKISEQTYQSFAFAIAKSTNELAVAATMKRCAWPPLREPNVRRLLDRRPTSASERPTAFETKPQSGWMSNGYHRT